MTTCNDIYIIVPTQLHDSQYQYNIIRYVITKNHNKYLYPCTLILFKIYTSSIIIMLNKKINKIAHDKHTHIHWFEYYYNNFYIIYSKMSREKSVSNKQSYAEVLLGAHCNLHGDGIIDNKHNILHIIP